MTVSVRRAETSQDLDAVLALPHRLYRNDPVWVPPVRLLERRNLRPSNPFFRKARLELFLAERDGEVVGSLSALRDKGFEKDKGERVAWFGYFETIDDPEVARALFEAVEETARGWGATHLRGPRNLTRFEYMGLAVEGHHARPPFLQGHHGPYYAALLEGLGFEQHHDMLAYETPLVDELGHPLGIPPEMEAKADACAIADLHVRPASRRSLRRDLVASHEVLNDAFQTVPDIAPMSLQTWVNVGRVYLLFANPEMLQIAFSGDEPIAFAGCLPEFNEALVQMAGEVFPAGWLRATLALPQVRTASFKLIGVKQAYRGQGLHAVLIRNVIEGARRAGYARLEMSVVDERNAPMRGIIENAGCTVYRRYRMFDKALL